MRIITIKLQHNRKLVCHVHIPSLGGGVGAQGLGLPIKGFTRAHEVMTQVSGIIFIYITTNF